MKTQRHYLAMAAIAGMMLTTPAFAQNGTYKLEFDNPYSYHRLITNINLIQLELASPTTFRLGLGAEYNVTSKLLVHADYNFEPISSFNSEAIRKTQNQFEAGGIYAFSSRLKEDAKMKIRFHTGHARYQMKLRASVLKQYGVRGGVATFSTPKKHGAFISYSSAPSLYAGLVIMRTKSILVDVDEYGTYDKESRGKFYADVMFAPVISLSDNTNYAAYAGSAASSLTAADFPDLVKNHIGVRLGYMKRSNNDIIPLYQGFETGIRPGVGNGFYVTFKIAISLGFMEGNTPKTR